MADWMLILGYIFFVMGGILVLVGFGRLIWWAVDGRKKRPKRRGDMNPNFYTYYKDPWLKASSMASVASQSKDEDENSLHVDTDVIYAQPADADPRGAYLHSTPLTEHELSQTESQIYANGSGSSSGNSSKMADGQHIYSVPHKSSKKSFPSIDEESGSVSGHAPELPRRSYIDILDTADGISLTEADRSSMREISYLEPPADYSPERRIPNLKQSETDPNFAYTTYTTNYLSGSMSSIGHMTGSTSSNQRSRSRPQELSGSELIESAGHSGTGDRRSSTPGSVKSMKSLYQYMYADEPLSLDREMEYTFTSSLH